jgi:anti-sigma B factor antagonist
MSLKMNFRRVGDVTIVDLNGRITLGDASGTLRETLRDLIAKGQKNVLLNLGDVSYVDSSGLGELIGAYASITNQGGRLKLLNVQKKIGELLQITKLYSVFESFTDEAEAVRSFREMAAAT